MKRSTERILKQSLRVVAIILSVMIAFHLGTLIGRSLIPAETHSSDVSAQEDSLENEKENVTLSDHKETKNDAVPDAVTSQPAAEAHADKPAEAPATQPGPEPEQSASPDTVDFEALKYVSVEELFGSKGDMHDMMPYADLLAFIAEVPGTSDFEYYLCLEAGAVKAAFVHNGETVTAYAVRSGSLVSANWKLEPAYSVTKSEGVTVESVEVFSDGSVSGYYNSQLGLSVFICSNDRELIQNTIV